MQSPSQNNPIDWDRNQVEKAMAQLGALSPLDADEGLGAAAEDREDAVTHASISYPRGDGALGLVLRPAPGFKRSSLSSVFGAQRAATGAASYLSLIHI